VKFYLKVDVRNPFGAPVYFSDETESTMDDAREIASRATAERCHGTVAMAGFQSAGRGRFRDRVWEGEREKDLLFTIVLYAARVASAALPLSCGLALSLAIDSAREGRGAEPRIKWPNDVLVGGKKVSGILCEASGAFYYAGIGINCSKRKFPAPLAPKATSLQAAYGKAIDPRAFLPILLDELKVVLSRPFDPRQIEARLQGLGEPISFLEGSPDKRAIIEGKIAGIGRGGELLLDVAGKGTVPVISGEILWGEDKES
jgi:BirA family transcriptional regulator, biotin operon repressor / biotin---[acetyl-CoA-carboxylase] ligase